MRFANRLPTGPGSRGGQWHDAEYRRAYFRRWRAEHPDYRVREVLRSALRKRAARLDRDRREVEALLGRPADIERLDSASRPSGAIA